MSPLDVTFYLPSECVGNAPSEGNFNFHPSRVFTYKFLSLAIINLYAFLLPSSSSSCSFGTHNVRHKFSPNNPRVLSQVPPSIIYYLHVITGTFYRLLLKSRQEGGFEVSAIVRHDKSIFKVQAKRLEIYALIIKIT